MTPFHQNIEEAALNNEKFRQVLYTSQHAQVVVMSLLPNEDIGSEVHELDQILVIVSGTGVTVLDGQESPLKQGELIVVPQGTEHNIINQGETPMKLYTVYTPPAHRDGTIHATKAEAEADEEDHY